MSDSLLRLGGRDTDDGGSPGWTTGGQPALVNVAVTLYRGSGGTGVALRALLTPEGVLAPLLEFCEENVLSRSLAWSYDIVHAVKLFLAYSFANVQVGDDWHDLLLGFAQKLHLGTCDVAGNDPSGLFWAPRTWQNAREQLAYVSRLFVWLEARQPVNQRRQARYIGNSFDRRLEQAAYQYRRNAALLGHTWPGTASKSRGRVVPYVASRKSPSSTPESRPAFPEHRFDELLFDGFTVHGRKNFRDMLITLLLNKAAMRISEPFHLYVSDVFSDPSNPSSATVLIHHPSEGLAPTRSATHHAMEKRSSYLRREWGIVPRNERDDAKGAGWKGGLHETVQGSPVFRAYWFPEKYGKVFLDIWYQYLAETSSIERTHPFAFVNTMGRPIGDMYSVGKFFDSHATAVKRIGLIPAKELGTTPHGHRHAYGQRAQSAEVHPKVIMKAMHHRSEKSQEVYTQPGFEQVRSELRIAESLRNESAARSAKSVE